MTMKGWAAGPAAKRSSGVGACVRGQSRDEHPDDEDADRAADGRHAIAPAVRLGAPWTSAGRIRLLAGFRQVCAQRAAEPRPRGADQANPSGPAGWSYLARCD